SAYDPPRADMKLPPFEYEAPSSLDEAIALLAAGEGNARPLAGGQSLLPMMAFRLAQPSLLVDLARIPGLDRIEATEAGLRLGALVTWRKIQEDLRVSEACPLLAVAIKHVAHYQIRNRGTIGGSLAHADPAAEMPTIALTCEAVVEVIGRNGKRRIEAADLFVGPLMTSLEADEIILAIEIPGWPRKRRWAFEEFARRRGDFALAGIAMFYDQDASGRACNVHIGAIGAADTPIRLTAAEATLDGRAVDEAAIAAAAKAACEEIDPAGDLHGGAAYRKALVGTLLQRATRRAAAQP
ncbi:MAG TPA: xanthine dehydrogenase family protein subunit M, partial [Beijerinckiaceae bacterium]|nr:xanthine dehydrogenase family protein subunit M [Beijerinckiaceae bacterium]